MMAWPVLLNPQSDQLLYQSSSRAEFTTDCSLQLMGRQRIQRSHFRQIILCSSHKLGLDQGADLQEPLEMEVGGVGSPRESDDHRGSGELFKPRLRDECRLTMGPCG